MPLKIIRQDITKIECDAIVNPTNRHLEPGGGADLAIHEAAGPELYEYCKNLGGCEVGKAKITPAFNLPCKYIIHTAGPNWIRLSNAEEVLKSCYIESLKLAIENNCTSVAIPLIGAGAYGCPKQIVLKTATESINQVLIDTDILVYLVVYDNSAFCLSKRLFDEVTVYIDDNYVSEHSEFAVLYNEYEYRYQSLSREELQRRREKILKEIKEKSTINSISNAPKLIVNESKSISDFLNNMDKGFADTLFYFIDKKGISDVECYKNSNVDKKTFSKIKCNKDYKPSKKTAVSFAIGLRLTLEEANYLLKTAGFSLSNCNKFDVIIQYFLTTGKYNNIFDVNEVLFQFDQVLLGV